MIAYIKELIVLYLPTILVVIEILVNYLILFRQVKSIDYKTPLMKANNSLTILIEDISSLKEQNNMLLNALNRVLKNNQELSLEYDDFKKTITQKYDEQNKLLINLSNRNAELQGKLNKKEIK